MFRDNTLKVSQLFCLLYVCQMVINITYSTYIADNGNMSDYILSFLCSYVITFVMLLPIYFLCKKNGNSDIFEIMQKGFGKLSYALIMIYSLYFLVVCVYNFSFYNNYISNIMTPQISIIFVCVAVMACSVFGALKGIEGIGKTSIVIFILFVAGFLFLICAMTGDIKDYNFTPLLCDGNDSFLYELKTMLTHSSGIIVIAVVFSKLRGNLKLGIFAWNSIGTITLIALTLVMVGALGDYVKTQMYPMYALAGIARLGVFKRMDSVYIAIWTSGLFIKISLFLYCFAYSFKKMFSERVAKIAMVIAAVFVCASSLIFNFNGDVYFFSEFLTPMLIFTFAVAVFIPLIILFILKIRKQDG